MQRLSPKPRTPKLQVRDLLRAEIRSSKPRFWTRLRKASLPGLPEAIEAAVVLAAVMGFGLGWALWLEPSPLETSRLEASQFEVPSSAPASLSGTAYPEPAMTTPDPAKNSPHTPAESTEPHVEEWLVDGFNLLHAVLLGGEDRSEWWKAAGRERVVEAVAAAVDVHEGRRTETGAAPSGPSRVWVVFDGSRPALAPDGTSNACEGDRLQSLFAPSADDWLVRRVKAAPNPAQVVVVTGDRKLANRVRHHGARLLSPSDFLSRKA